MTHIVATHVTQSGSTELTLERTLTAGTGITVTDGGAGSTITVTRNAMALDDLSDTTITSAADGEVLTFNGSAWVNEAAAETISVTELHEHVMQEDHSGEANGSKTNMITAQEYQPQNVNVFVNGLMQRYSVDFTEDTTYDAITFTTAPVTGDSIIMEYITA